MKKCKVLPLLQICCGLFLLAMLLISNVTANAAEQLIITAVEAEDAVLNPSADFSTDVDTASHGGSHIRTQSKNATVTLTFQGVGIRFFTKKGSGAGSLDVSVDGVSCGQADEYVSGAAAFQAKVFEKLDLSVENEEHTIVLTTSSSNPHGIANPWFNFDYFEVLSRDSSEQPGSIVSPGNTTYYVDSSASAGGDGLSEASPFHTLDEINRRSFAPGDVILLKRGSSFTGQLYPKGSGSAEKPVKLDVYGTGEKPLIDGNGRFSPAVSYGENGPFGEGGSAVYLLNSEYWEISNLKVTNWDTATANRERSGIRIEAAGGGTYHHIYIKDCDIYDVRGYRGQDSIWDVNPPAGGTAFYGSRTTHRTGGINIVSYTNRENNSSNKKDPGKMMDSEPTIFDDILVEGNTIERCDANGITTTNVKGSLDDRDFRHTNVVIRNNRIHDVQRAGIVPLYTNGALVERNTVDTFQQTSEGYGCGIWCDRANDMMFQYNEVCNGKNTMDGMAFNLDDMTENGIIQYNYTHNNVGGGTMLHVRTNSYNRNNTIRYNLSVNDTYNFADHQAIIVCVGEDANTKIESAKVYNNTFFNTRTVHPIYQGNEIAFSNNIFYLTSAGLKSKTNAYITGSSTTFTNNLFAGVHSKDEPSNNEANHSNIQAALPGLAGMLVTKQEDGSYLPKKRADAEASMKLAFQSVALNAGAIIPGNGGKDYLGNSVSSDTAPHIGAYNADPVEKFELEDFDQTADNGEPTEFDDFQVSYVEGENSAVTKIGAFTTADSGAHGGTHIHSSEDDASVEYEFTGIAVSVYTKTGPGAGIADVYLDGVKVASDDQYAASESFDRLAYTHTFAESGTHKIKVVRNGNKNPSSQGASFNFDCFKIFQVQAPVTVEGTLEKLDSSIFTASAESVELSEGPAVNAIDGKENTYWHSNWSGSADQKPDFAENLRNSFTIDLGASLDIQKVEYLPRQDQLNGCILQYKLFYSPDETGEFLPVPRGIGKWTEDLTLKTAVFEKARARRLQIRVYAAAGDNTGSDLISAAEFSVFQVTSDVPEPEKVTVTVKAEAGGTAEGGATTDKGSVLTLTARPEQGYSFHGWFQGETLLSEQLSFDYTAEETVTLTARFRKDEIPPEKVSVTAQAETGGTASGSAVVEKGTAVTFTAAADPGYTFLGWFTERGELVSELVSFTFTAEENMCYVARFLKDDVPPVPEKVTITVQAQEGGTASGNTIVEKGTAVTLTAAAKPGYQFIGWYLGNDKVSDQASWHFTATENAAYTARFQKLPAPAVKPGIVSKVQKSGTVSSVKLTWKKAPNAVRYEISRLKGKKWTVLKTVSSAKYTDKKVKYGTKYTYRIRAISSDGIYGDYSTPIKASSAPKKTKLSVQSKGTKKAVLTWKKSSKADGYDIFMKTGKGKYKPLKTKSAKGRTYTKGGLKKNKSYTFQIKPFIKIGSQKIYAAPATQKLKW